MAAKDDWPVFPKGCGFEVVEVFISTSAQSGWAVGRAEEKEVVRQRVGEVEEMVF